MGQQTSREHAPLTFGYINHSTAINEKLEEQIEEFDQKDFVLENPHLYKLQAVCDHCNTTSENDVVLSSTISESCTQCKRRKRLSLVRKSLAEDLEYIDQTYYPDLVHYNTNTDEEDPMEKELLEFQQQEEEQWSRLTIGDAVTSTTSMRRPRKLTGPSMNVDLSNKSLVKLSPSIGYLQNLTKLNLSNNQMVTIPREIGYLKNLRVLNVNNNMLEQIPDTIAFLSKLKAFNVSQNKLIQLPPAIGQLSKLVIFIANDNQLTSLPREFARLNNLVSLNVSRNPLKSLPAEIAELASLRKFITEDCPFEEEYTYELKHNTPSLFELCARVAVRTKMHMPNDLADHIKDYLTRVDTCSYCKGPFFESYVTRMRFIERRARQIIALEDRMCCAHWNTEEDRLLNMFSEQSAHVDHTYHPIDMNGLHETPTNRHRAYSDTSSNYNTVPSSYMLKRSNTNSPLGDEEHPAHYLKPLPSLPALAPESSSRPRNRPRSSSTTSMTKRLTKFMRSNSHTEIPRQRSDSTSSLSRPQINRCLTPSPLHYSEKELPQWSNQLELES